MATSFKRTEAEHLDTNKTVWLQGVGETLAVSAEDLQVGDEMVWNGGGTSKVVAIVPKGKVSLVVTEQYVGYMSGKLETGERVFRKNRLVPVQFDGMTITTNRTKDRMGFPFVKDRVSGKISHSG